MRSRLVAVITAALVLPGFVSLAAQQQQKAPAAGKRPVDYANALVGTAPLDDPALIGNAPPPGERLYSGITSAGATLPHSSTILAPVNNNTDVEYPAGVATTYYYPNRTMYGFSTGTMGGPTVMAVVGDFTVPPERSGSVYDKAREKASPGYYSVYLDDYKTRVEMTATTWTGIFRFTFPGTTQAHVLLDLGRIGGDVEVVGSNMGAAETGPACLHRCFSWRSFRGPLRHSAHSSRLRRSSRALSRRWATRM
jgi:putative alpha-1,2-mannosidase